LKNDEKAIENFKRTLELSPGLYQAQLNLGMVYVRNHKAEAALPLLQAAVKAKPEAPQAHLYLAETYQLLGKWPDAQTEYQEALNRNPKAGRAELGLGEALMHQGKLDEAEPHFQQAVALDSSLKSYLLEYAVALADNGRPEKAIPILQQFPQDIGAHEKLGQLYLASKQPDKAVPEFEVAVRNAPTAANKVALATAYLRNNEEAQAAPLLKEALAAAPNDWELMMTVGRIYRDQKNYRDAGNYFLSAARVKPDAPDSWSELAGVLTLSENYSQALTALDKLHELHAEKPGHYYLRAIILDKFHQLKPAIASYQQFLNTDQGQNPDQEFQARGRLKVLEHQVNGR
jgi:tetratricopeptide (TPR) repeat protein